MVSKRKKRFLTIPIALLIILCIFYPEWRDNISKSYKAISDLINPKTYITKDELDVMNEWVIVVWAYQDKELAEKEYKNFATAYHDYGDSSLCKDIHLVRSCLEEKAWMLTIDYGEGKQSDSVVTNAIQAIRKVYNKDRYFKNNLGQLLDDCYSLFYDQEKFEYYNGKIVNIHNLDILKKH